MHDFYRRFIRRDATEKHYVAAGRAATAGLFLAASGLVFLLDTAKDAFDLILQIGAGTGLLYLVRWFWWRVTAWAEIAAMTASFAVSVFLLILRRNGILLPTHAGLLITVAFTTVCWMLTVYLGPKTDRRTLISFYQKVRPAGPGWTAIRKEAGITEADAAGGGESLPMVLLGWAAGCSTIWSALFTVGNFLYGRWAWGFGLLAWSAVSALVLVKCLNSLWRKL